MPVAKAVQADCHTALARQWQNSGACEIEFWRKYAKCNQNGDMPKRRQTVNDVTAHA